jgi:transcriptional antiterminator NusG
MSETELEKSMEVDTGSNADSNVDDMRWYVVQAYSGFEKRVQQSMQTRIDRSDIKDQFGQVLVPTEDVVELKNGQKRTSERKFFPGYVLVQMAMSETAWHLVKSVPRVSGFVGGTSAEPVPISDREAQAILQQVVEGAEHPRPKYTFAPGEVVRVTDGPFQEFNGTVEDVNFEKSKLRVAVTIFGRSTPVELSFSQVEKG